MQEICWRHFRDGYRYAYTNTASGERASIIEIKKATMKREATYRMQIIGSEYENGFRGTIAEIMDVLNHI